MSLWHQQKPLNLLVMVLLFELAVVQQPQRNLALADLVPNIKTDYYELKSAGNQYSLSLNIPNGQRRETVELRARGTANEALFVKGITYTYYDDTGHTLVISYEAGKNGYVAKIQYVCPISLKP